MHKALESLPIFGFAAASGTGKTTLLTQLIPLLRCKGLRVGVIKHSHHDLEIDKPGKDSYRLREAGADQIMLASSKRRFLIVQHAESKEPTLADELMHFPRDSVDIVLVEGFKHEKFPKVELVRPSLGNPLLHPNDDSIIALASDVPIEPARPLPVLDLNVPADIARFVIDRVLT